MSWSPAPKSSEAPVSGEVRSPNLLLIGAMKASTTTLYELLRQHPAVWFPDHKEPHYFTSPAYGQAAAWQQYVDCFRGCPADVRWIGEASTGYTKLPHLGPTPQRIQETLGHPRLVYSLRDPVDRIVSNFRHNHAVGLYRPGFSLQQAMSEDPIIVSASLYARQLRAYCEVFGSGSVYVMIAEQLHRDVEQALSKLLGWLELDVTAAGQGGATELNRWQNLSRSHRVARWVPQDWRPAVRRWLPASIRRAVRAAVPAIEPPAVADAERRLAVQLVSEDLRELQDMLSDHIADWPTVQMLQDG